jgi:inorganic triphosphatase YgiF
MPTEVELKLSVSPGALRDAMKLPWLGKLAGGPFKPQMLTSVYFDTGKFKLRDNGLTLRIRTDGKKRLQTIKADNTPSASGRAEWENEVARRKPDLKIAKKTGLKPLLTRKLKRKRSLRPVFETSVKRTIMPLHIGKSDLEVAFDRGQIKAGGLRASVSEIELELKRGDRSDLARVAERIRRSIPVAYGARTKSERGYALSAGGRSAAVDAKPIALKAGTVTGEAFTVIGLACLHHLAANEDAVRRGASEGVHQMRVGLRRLRAAISLFKNMLQDRESEDIKARLKWLTEQLAAARDLDVLVEEGVAPLCSASPDMPEMKVLESDLKERRAEGFEKAKALVGSERYRRIVLDVALWLINGEWFRDKDALAAVRRAQPIEAFARNVVSARTRKIIKRCAMMKDIDAQARHKLRIAVKKLRYATDFFARLFDRPKTKKARTRFERELKALQSALGKLNDIHVHQRLARNYAQAGSRSKKQPQKAFAIGVLSGREQSGARNWMAAAIKAGKAPAKSDRFWR